MESKRHIFCDRGTADQIKVLEDHSDVQTDLTQLFSFQGSDFIPFDQYLSGSRRLKQIDHPDKRALAGSAGPYNTKDFSFLNGQIHIFNRLKILFILLKCHSNIL